MANKLTQSKIDEMWAAWQEKQSIQSVARKCMVSSKTVRRYRQIDKWDERLAGIKAKAQKKSDNEAAERRARHAKIGQLLQVKGAKWLQAKDIKKAETAIKAVETGVKIEREAVGLPGQFEVTHKYDKMSIEELKQLLQQRKQSGSL